MYTVHYGGRQGRALELVESVELLAVRSVTREPVLAERTFEAAPLSEPARGVLAGFQLQATFRGAGVEVLRTRQAQQTPRLRDQARAILKREPAVRFAGRVLRDAQADAPVLYTENFFVKFADRRALAWCRQVLQRYDLVVRQELDYAPNAFFVSAPEGTGLAVFDLAERLLEEPGVELCHPELIREVRGRGAFPQQWHLKAARVNGQAVNAHANVEAAWGLSRGEGIVVAVVDDGVDVDHEEFGSPGKIHGPQNVSLPAGHPGRADPRPGSGENHGTACAGVACADGRFGASGVAPLARLMPIRLTSGLGSMAEAEAFVYAARNGADVISCSWGPRDGRWWDPADPVHAQVVPLPDSTRLAIDWAVQNGRGGKGCVIVWAAGNGNERVENDGYASHPQVIAVGACNDVETRSAYSDFGRAVWCAFPSSHGEPSRTPGIWTTDRSGPAGYNAGLPSRGDVLGHYTNSFGGTSSAAPGVAGVAALVLSRNPRLAWTEVRDVIRRACVRIDPAGGGYDADGHSSLYGYGRVDARKAVELALPTASGYLAVHTAMQAVPIAPPAGAQLPLQIGETTPLKEIRVLVDVAHPAPRQLVLSLLPPPGLGARPVVLHNGAAALRTSYDGTSTRALASLVGKQPVGTWVLQATDRTQPGSGQIHSFSLWMRF